MNNATENINDNLKARLRTFTDGIDAYIANNHLNSESFSEEFKAAEKISFSDMEKLTRDDCFGYAFQLYQYADHVGKERATCETVLRWCENSLNSILSFEMEELSNVIAKHEMKVARILRNNDLARKVNEWKMTAEGRLEPLKNREYNIRRKAEILMEKGKRK